MSRFDPDTTAHGEPRNNVFSSPHDPCAARDTSGLATWTKNEEQSMKALRLGTYELPPGEVVLVQTLFRLYGQNKPFPWTFVTAPPYDALLVDGMATARAAQAEPMAKAVLRLTRMNAADAPGTLQRPIRADRFQGWLHTIEADLLEPATAPPPPTAPRPAPAAAETTGPESAAAAARFKLRRWPPAILLRADPQRIRLATLLSRRALSSAELAQLSQQPQADCQGFLSLLQNAGLIEREDVAPTPRAPATAAAPPRARLGLVASIRRRLGL